MNRDVVAWCCDCQHCARAKVTKQPTAAVQPIPVPRHRFTHVHVDLVGPLSTKPDGYRYLFTMVDRTTRWLEAIPLRDIDAATCADAFTAAWVARFGVPAVLTSDQGRQFISTLWGRLCEQLGVQHQLTTAYHPQANGMVERVHRQLKDALRARLAGAHWAQHLPWVLLGLHAAPKEDSGLSSAELLYGEPLVLPGQFLSSQEPDIQQLLRQLCHVQPLPTHPLPSMPLVEPPKALASAKLVYVRRGAAAASLTAQYQGPYKVVERGPKFFRLRLGSLVEPISEDRLKPDLGATPTPPGDPPRWGRPPAARDARSYAQVVTGGAI